MTELRELPVPPDAASDPGAAEILRGWFVNGDLQMCVERAFSDPAAWGLVLADIARQATRLYAAEGICSETEALQKIRTTFDAECDDPNYLGSTSSTRP